MQTQRYDRTLHLRCPTCGCDQFAFEDGVDETIELATCAACGRILTKDELVRDNGELIELQVEELGAELVRDAAVEMRKALEKALKGSKHFRLR